MAKFGCLGIPAALFLLADVSLPMAMETTRVSLEPPGSSPSAKTPGWSGTWQRLKSRFMPSFLSNGLKRSIRRKFRKPWTWLRALLVFLVVGGVISVATLNSVSDEVRGTKITKKEVVALCPTVNAVKPERSYFDWIFGGSQTLKNWERRGEFDRFKEKAKLDILRDFLKEFQEKNTVNLKAEQMDKLLYKKKLLYERKVEDKLNFMLKEVNAKLKGRNCLNINEAFSAFATTSFALIRSGSVTLEEFRKEVDQRIAEVEQIILDRSDREILSLKKLRKQAAFIIASLIQIDLRLDFPELQLGEFSRKDRDVVTLFMPLVNELAEHMEVDLAAKAAKAAEHGEF